MTLLFSPRQLYNMYMYVYLRELAIEISLTSFGSSQTFLFPQSSTAAASRFWSFRETWSKKYMRLSDVHSLSPTQLR